MRRILTIIALILALTLAASGCARLDLPPMGEAHRQQIASQTLDPDAGGDAPVLGLHGQRAERVMEAWISGDEKTGADPMATQMAPQ